MYTNVGKKIMRIAKILGIIFLCGSIICAFGAVICLFAFLSIQDSSGDPFYFSCPIFLGIAIVCFLMSLSTLPLYGFGQQVDQLNDFHRKTFNNVSINSDELPEL